MDRRGGSERGSLLIFTIWVLTMLTIFTLAVGYQVQGRLRFIQRFEIREKLRHIADAGVEKALAVIRLAPPALSTLKDRWSHSPQDFKKIVLNDGYGTVSYVAPWDAKIIRYGVVDEESKIDINQVSSPRILAALFEKVAGLSETDASVIADSIVDWRDEDDMVFANGAEGRYYRSLPTPYAPKNAPFDVLEELFYVRGVTPAIYKKIQPYLTVAGSKAVNVNTASPAIFFALGIPPGLVDTIERYRRGQDRLLGTRDDHVFSSGLSMPDELAASENLRPEEAEFLRGLAQSGLLDTVSQNFTIRSRARLDHRREALIMTCVVNQGVIKYCSEKYTHRKTG